MSARYITALLVFIASSAVCDMAYADPVKPVNQGIEIQSSDFVLPSSDSGTVFFNSCGSCKLSSLRLTSSTNYLIGTHTVSLRELSQFLQKGGPYFVMIYRELKEPLITKIVVHADYRPSLAR